MGQKSKQRNCPIAIARKEERERERGACGQGHVQPLPTWIQPPQVEECYFPGTQKGRFGIGIFYFYYEKGIHGWNISFFFGTKKLLTNQS